MLTESLWGLMVWGLSNRVEDVSNLASIGIVLLLFAVGMEFSFKKIIEYRNIFFVGGPLQVVLTTLFGYLIASYLGRPMGVHLPWLFIIVK